MPVAERLLEIWENIGKLVNYWEKLPKSKRPSSTSYINVKLAVHDVLTPAKLKFFLFYRWDSTTLFEVSNRQAHGAISLQ